MRPRQDWHSTSDGTFSRDDPAFQNAEDLRLALAAAEAELEKLRPLVLEFEGIVYSAANSPDLHCGLYTAKGYRFTVQQIAKLKTAFREIKREGE